MSNVGLFIAGVLVTIPAFLGIVGLIVAAVADGRENDRIHAEQEAHDPSSR
jgi:hypothetical protein